MRGTLRGAAHFLFLSKLYFLPRVASGKAHAPNGATPMLFYAVGAFDRNLQQYILIINDSFSFVNPFREKRVPFSPSVS